MNHIIQEEVKKPSKRYVLHVGVGIYYSGTSLQEATNAFYKWSIERPKVKILLEEVNKLFESGPSIK